MYFKKSQMKPIVAFINNFHENISKCENLKFYQHINVKDNFIISLIYYVICNISTLIYVTVLYHLSHRQISILPNRWSYLRKWEWKDHY